ncbi:hypothetical protein ACFQ8W_00415 [Streptomyces sp. NPDC056508]|uniref:deoxynucleotide monophosphate kinase family protein n=1 Tax=Streptomyces sp. NPDC056508 TaxID=3345845 RepID=UPI0036AC2AAC
MNIAIAGRARAGKDTVGRYLVETRGYRRVAFADALKEAALQVDPMIGWVPTEDSGALIEIRLSEYVRSIGWEHAKEDSEVRRFLQELGAAMRAVDPEIWIRAAMEKADEANDDGVPCVITDMRYPNELTAIQRYRHWHTIHIDRPDVPQLVHESEGAIGPEDTAFMIHNAGTLDNLHRQVDVILAEIDAIESARHYARSL